MRIDSFDSPSTSVSYFRSLSPFPRGALLRGSLRSLRGINHQTSGVLRSTADAVRIVGDGVLVALTFYRTSSRYCLSDGSRVTVPGSYQRFSVVMPRIDTLPVSNDQAAS